MNASDVDDRLMTLALELAARGQGCVEPNPMVGCVIARADEVVAEGWHQQFGGPHAEVAALGAAGEAARGATMYVSLEPCCHQGKTPPCTEAVVQAGVARVVVALRDPFEKVAGGGIGQLRQAGLTVDVAVQEPQARRLNAPYLKLVQRGRPWTIAKWAMTLDGKIASRSGESRWISSAASRTIVHKLRARVDAILIGRATAEADDPLLTARPPGPRTATRIVCDTQASLSPESQLARTSGEAPVLVAATADAPPQNRRRLEQAGCEVLACDGATHAERLTTLLDELGRRRMTNLLVEGGGRLLGSFFDAQLVDEVHVFIAPKIVGGAEATGPLDGIGLERIGAAENLTSIQFEQVDGDLYVRGWVARKS